MEYTEKKIEEIILKSYFQGMFETITGDCILNKVTIDHNWYGHTRVFMYIHLEQFNNTSIDRIDSLLNMFETPDEFYNAVTFCAEAENVLKVAFSTTREEIQLIIERNNEISFEEDR